VEAYPEGTEAQVSQPTAKNTEELMIFVEREMHFVNLWTMYTDMLEEKYIPSLGLRDLSVHDPRTTMMLVLYAYFYSLVEDSSGGMNAFRIWREHFPEEGQAISAVEAQILPFRDKLRVFRNRLGFHGSTSRAHEAPGFALFGAHSGLEILDAIKNFKALGAMLLAKELATRKTDAAGLNQAREHLDFIARRAREQTGTSTL
jgi:hypothetical protein